MTMLSITNPLPFSLVEPRHKLISKAEVMAYLAGFGMQTPLYGTPGQIAEAISSDTGRPLGAFEDLVDVVVYAGRECGRLKMPLSEAIAQHSDSLAVQHIPTKTDGTGISYSYTAVGGRRFWLRHESADDWRSVAGAFRTEIVSDWAVNTPVDCAPFFSVNFILVNNRRYAISLSFDAEKELSAIGFGHFLQHPYSQDAGNSQNTRAMEGCPA